MSAPTGAVGVATLPQPLRGSTFGLDLGATNHRSRSRRSSAAQPRAKTGPSADSHSLIELLAAAFRAEGFAPEAAVLALAGSWEPGEQGAPRRFRLTNLPSWPTSTEKEIEDVLGIRRVMFTNDLPPAQYETRFVDLLRLVLMQGGSDTGDDRHSCVLTVSSGVNWATQKSDPDAPLALDREQGHGPFGSSSWSPQLVQLAKFAARYFGKPCATPELLLGGNFLQAIYLYLRDRNAHARVDEAEALIADELGIGKLMTTGAINDRWPWTEIAGMFAEMLGTLLHGIIVGELVDELFLQGSVISGTPGFADWLMQQKVFTTALRGKGSTKDHLPRNAAIWAVPNGVHLAADGAERYARRLIAAD